MLNNKTLGEIVKQDYDTAKVLYEHGLDFCCNGDRNIIIACKDKGINSDVLLKELENVLENKSKKEDIDLSDLNKIIDYILDKHHVYVRSESPFIISSLEKLIKVHDEKYHPLNSIHTLFSKIFSDMEPHMLKEEQIIFPYIKSLLEAQKSNKPRPRPFFNTVINPINKMISDHETAGNEIKELRELTKDFSVPEDACNTYRTTFAKLKEFESDLFHHVHLENNVLFPESIKLEKKLD